LTLAARLEVVALDLLLARTPAPAAAAPASEGDVSAMTAALQADFQTADLQWAQWRILSTLRYGMALPPHAAMNGCSTTVTTR